MYHRLLNENDDLPTLPNDKNSFEFKNRSKEKKNRDGSNSSFEIDSNKYDVIEHTIMPNETLRGIALRYNCSVSQLRIMNHIMSDQDFFMLKILRIPVLKHSLFTQKDQQQTHTQFVNDLIDIQGDSISSKTQVINIGISKYLSENNENKDYQQFLNNLSSDLEEMRKLNESKFKSVDPIVAENLSEDTKATISSADNDANIKSNCDGSDYGINWTFLVLFIVFLCLLVPLYVLYNLEHHNSTHHHYR